MDEEYEEQVEYTAIVVRKVADSGYISYSNHIYYVSKALAGKYVTVRIIKERLVVETHILLRKEYALKG